MNNVLGSGFFRYSPLLLFSLVFAAQSVAEIRVTNDMAVIEKEVVPGTLLVFDLDNTLIEGIETVACDQWFDYYLKELKDQGMEDAAAVSQANALWMRIQEVAEVRPVEPATVALVKRCQMAGYKVMGLTARPAESAALTKRQLESAGIDFTGSLVYDKEVSFKLKSNARYSNGVLFIDELNKKGETISYFLKRINFTPMKIVFADDKRKHSENMELEMGKLGIPFVGFQYTRTYERAKQLDFSLSDIQLKYLGKILPDSMARILLENAIRSDE